MFGGTFIRALSRVLLLGLVVNGQELGDLDGDHLETYGGGPGTSNQFLSNGQANNLPQYGGGEAGLEYGSQGQNIFKGVPTQSGGGGGGGQLSQNGNVPGFISQGGGVGGGLQLQGPRQQAPAAQQQSLNYQNAPPQLSTFQQFGSGGGGGGAVQPNVPNVQPASYQQQQFNSQVPPQASSQFSGSPAVQQVATQTNPNPIPPPPQFSSPTPQQQITTQYTNPAPSQISQQFSSGTTQQVAPQYNIPVPQQQVASQFNNPPVTQRITTQQFQTPVLQQANQQYVSPPPQQQYSPQHGIQTPQYANTAPPPQITPPQFNNPAPVQTPPPPPQYNISPPPPRPQQPSPPPPSYQHQQQQYQPPPPPPPKPIQQSTPRQPPPSPPSTVPKDVRAPYPYPACPPSTFCVQEEYCNAYGLIEENPLRLSSTDKLYRAGLVQNCSQPATGNKVGVCCRDPNYNAVQNLLLLWSAQPSPANYLRLPNTPLAALSSGACTCGRSGNNNGIFPTQRLQTRLNPGYYSSSSILPFSTSSLTNANYFAGSGLDGLGGGQMYDHHHGGGHTFAGGVSDMDLSTSTGEDVLPQTRGAKSLSNFFRPRSSPTSTSTFWGRRQK